VPDDMSVIQQREHKCTPTIYHPLETHYDSVVVHSIYKHNSSSTSITSPLLNPPPPPPLPPFLFSSQLNYLPLGS
jgi:hypothetical protein